MGNDATVFSESDFGIAWALFRQLHGHPSKQHADRLVRWLGEDPAHARALDRVLTLWALSGAALAGAGVMPDGPPLQ
ncbi:MAG: FecR/PupR family sigma factor regulator [Pseudacidovorax sp.]|nr:FecR/PupR family sigma factor regulator [Pseudacidovorax sp.]